MAIRFQCGACSQPIEVDDEWAQKLVVCPYCRKTVTAPMESMLPDPAEMPTATRLESPEVAVADFRPVEPDRPPLPTSNVLGKVAFGLACTTFVVACASWTIAFTHRDELQPALQAQMDRTPGEQFQAGQELAATLASGPAAEAWMAMSLLAQCAALIWVAALVCGLISVCRPVRRGWAVAALVITGIIPVLFCCGGLAFTLPA